MPAADEDLFDSEVPAQTTEGVSPEAPAPNRDDHGRFAPKDTGEEVEGAPPAPAEKQSQMVPLTAVQETRERARRAEARAAALELQIAQFQRQQEPQQPEMPDPITDAEGYTRHLEGSIQMRMDNQEAQFSEHLARKDFGHEVVNAALQAAQSAGVVQHFTRGVDRWHRLVQWHQEQRQYAERNSPQYEATLREKLRSEIMAEMGQPALPSSPRVPRSLATASGSAAAPPERGGGDPLFD